MPHYHISGGGGVIKGGTNSPVSHISERPPMPSPTKPNRDKFMAIQVNEAWGGEQSAYADTVHQENRPTHSKLLGPDGKPLLYERNNAGFSLKPARKRQSTS